MDASQAIEAKYQALAARLDEATLRLWAAAEARSLGRGGVSLVANAVGISRTTIYAGLAEIEEASKASKRRGAASAAASKPALRVRAAGGGRKKLTDLNQGLLDALDALVEPTPAAAIQCRPCAGPARARRAWPRNSARWAMPSASARYATCSRG